MKNVIMVMNSDSINLQGSRFTVGALFNGLYHDNLEGTPIHVSHDASRLIGWSRPFALYFEPGLTRIVGIGELVETEEEFEYLYKTYTRNLSKHLSTFQKEELELRNELTGHLTGQEALICVECFGICDKNIAEKVFPTIFALKDKDGLIPLKYLTPIGAGVYQIGKLVIFAHPFFRRALYHLNTLNYPFLKNFQSLDPESTKIAIDSDLVGLASTYRGEKQEFVYWWGPKFDDDLLSIPFGVTKHLAEENERIFHGISATEFRWGNMDNHHVFETEELRDIPTVSSNLEKYGCRYVHSMVSEETQQVDHLDGSIRMYSESEMLNRLETDIAHAGRHTEYTKLWRLDQTIPISKWKGLISDFFRDNFLVGEYFGAKRFDKSVWAKKQGATIQEQYVPYSITSEMGPRLALSIFPRTKTANSDIRTVESLDFMTDGQIKYPYVEAFSLELRKILLRKNSELFIPKKIRYVSFKDRYINLPLIYHPDNNLQLSIAQTLDAILLLVNFLDSKDKDWVLCYNIAFPLDKDREVRISTFGHIDALKIWLKEPLSRPPLVPKELHKWTEQVASFFRSHFKENIDHPDLFKILMSSGILLINRRRIQVKNLQFVAQNSNRKAGYTWEYDEKELDLKKLQECNIHPSLGYLLEESKCEKCGQKYEDCDCSKVLDKDVIQRIEKATPLLFWTDRGI